MKYVVFLCDGSGKPLNKTKFKLGNERLKNELIYEIAVDILGNEPFYYRNNLINDKQTLIDFGSHTKFIMVLER